MFEQDIKLKMGERELAEIVAKIHTMQQQKMWLSRINALFDFDGKDGEVNKKRFGFTTQFFADEGDDIFDVRCEINMALPENMRVLNPDIRKGVDHVMQAILNQESWDPECAPISAAPVVGEGDSKRSGEREVKAKSGGSAGFVKLSTEELGQMRALRLAVLSGTAASMTKAETASTFKVVAKVLYGKMDVKEGSVDEWVTFMTKAPEGDEGAKESDSKRFAAEAPHKPVGFTKEQSLAAAAWFASKTNIHLKKADDKEVKEKDSKEVAAAPSVKPAADPYKAGNKRVISAIKMILSNSLETALSNNPGIDAGLCSQNGCVVTPRKQKRELPHTQFGDEIELTLNHYLHYAAFGPSDKFLESCVRKMPLTMPDEYDRLVRRAGGGNKVADLVDFIKKSEQYDFRLMILREFVLEAGLVTIASEQITFNVHDAIRGRACGIASGTMNPASLPAECATKFKADSTRKVEAETYLRSVLGKYPAHVIDDKNALEEMEKVLVDTNVKAIINEGLALNGMDTVEIIRKLRSSPQGTHRQFIFIHPTHKKEYMWMPGPNARSPVPFDPSRLDRRNCVFYYDPADTRGVDFKIPPGKVILIPGPTTVHSSASQAAFRARLLGTGHKLQYWVLASVANRLRAQQKLADAPITPEHIVNDIKKRTLQEQAIFNFKAAVLRVKGIAFTGLRRKVLFRDDPSRYGQEYWDPCNREVVADILTNKGSSSIDPKTAINFKDGIRFLYDALADATLFGIEGVRDRMIQSKDFDFDKGLEPTKYVDTIERLTKMYDSEILELREIKARIANERDSLEMRMVAKCVTEFEKNIELDGSSVASSGASSGGSLSSTPVSSSSSSSSSSYSSSSSSSYSSSSSSSTSLSTSSSSSSSSSVARAVPVAPVPAQPVGAIEPRGIFGLFRGWPFNMKKADPSKPVEALPPPPPKVVRTHYETRLLEAEQEVDKLITKLGEARKEFVAAADEMRKYLPKVVEVSRTGSEGALATVQIQQHNVQHVTQITRQTVEDVPPVEEKDHTYEAPYFDHIFQAQFEGYSHIHDASAVFEGVAPMKVFVTSEVMKLIKEAPTLHKLPFAKLVVFKTKEWDRYLGTMGEFRELYKVCLIGKNDYSYALHKMEDSKITYEVYSLDYSAKLPADAPVGLIPERDYRQERPSWDYGLILQCAIARMMVGCTSFTEAEKKALKAWKVAESDLNRFLEQLGKKCSAETIHQFQEIRVAGVVVP